MQKHLKHPIFKVLADIADQTQTKAYVIGGFVRDLFLNRPSKDIDIVILGNGIEFAEKIKNQGCCFQEFWNRNVEV